MTDSPHKDNVTDGTADTGEHETFLARWSARKTEARKNVDLPEPEEHDAAGQEDDTAAGPPDCGSEPVKEAAPELPPLESLDENSDYSAFLDSSVDTDTQREALRKLFRSPKFNVTDGLDDYDLDYTNPEPLGNIVTAEMRHRIQLELEKLAGLDDESEDPVETVAAVDSDAQDEPAEEADVDTNDEHPEPS
jgi:hypothetical protein